MRLPSVGRYSWLIAGSRAVLSIANPKQIIMKYVVFFFLAFVALAAAAPQFVAAWPGYAAGVIPYPARTLVAGPTVVNGAGVYGASYVAPGYVGPAFI